MKNQRKTISIEEKLDAISRLEKGERIVDIWRNVRFAQISYVQFLTMLTELQNLLSHGLRSLYRDADKSLAQPASRCILFEGENISFDASLVLYINCTNIPPIMIINRIYEHQNLLSL